MYLVSRGHVTQGTEAPTGLGPGNIFGERRLLGLLETVDDSVVATETTVLFVLHRSVFRQGLSLFHSDSLHVDDIFLQWLNAKDACDLSQALLFRGCSQPLVQALRSKCQTRVVHPGEAILEEATSGDKLCFLRAGTATQHTESGSRMLTHWESPNAQEVLGLERFSGQVDAGTVCAVLEVETTVFLGILQRFPREVAPMLETMSGLWPQDDVSLFWGVITQGLFAQLMRLSEWQLFLPGQCVVKQGGHGDMMFLLCHGIASVEMDSVALGELHQGGVVGAENFLGVSNSYPSTVITRTVCHFRVLTASDLETALPDHPADQSAFTNVKARVRRGALEQQQHRAELLKRAKLQRRSEEAIREHVGKLRDVRGLQQHVFASLGDSVTEQVKDNRRLESPRAAPRHARPVTSPRSDSLGGVMMTRGLRLGRSGSLGSEPSRHLWLWRDGESPDRPLRSLQSTPKMTSLHSPIHDGRRPNPSSLPSTPRVASRHTPTHDARRTLDDFFSDTESEESRSTSTRGGSAWRWTMSVPRPVVPSKHVRIDTAIHEFARERRWKHLLGRLLRIKNNGLHVDCGYRSIQPITDSEMRQLDSRLPALDSCCRGSQRVRVRGARRARSCQRPQHSIAPV